MWFNFVQFVVFLFLLSSDWSVMVHQELTSHTPSWRFWYLSVAVPDHFHFIIDYWTERNKRRFFLSQSYVLELNWIFVIIMKQELNDSGKLFIQCLTVLSLSKLLLFKIPIRKCNMVYCQCTMVHCQCTMVHWRCTMIHWRCTMVLFLMG